MPNFGFFNPNYMLAPVSVVRLRYSYQKTQTHQNVTAVYVFGIRILHYQHLCDLGAV